MSWGPGNKCAISGAIEGACSCGCTPTMIGHDANT
jgi:hypothetical protein